MLDKIIMVSELEITLIFTNRAPFTVYAAKGDNVVDVLQWFLTHTTLSQVEFSSAFASSLETTVSIAA